MGAGSGENAPSRKPSGKKRRFSNMLVKSLSILRTRGNLKICVYPVLFLAVVTLGIAINGWGSIAGSVSGIVTDPSGAVIPRALVVATNTQTGVQRTVRTDNAGFYSFPELPVGNYEIVVRQTGFRAFRQTGLAI